MLKSLINLLFPKTCPGCDKLLLENEIIMCTACRHNLPLTYHHLDNENETYRKFYGRLPVMYASSMLYFYKKGVAQELIHNLKYRGQEQIGSVLGQWYAEDLKFSEILKTVDVIIPVPLHKKRLRERGFNQVTAFGKNIAHGLNAGYNERILQRKLYSKTQTKKNIFGRTAINVALFDVTFSDEDHNKHFLLVDDVITSGATLEACGKALLKIPGAKLSIVTIAYAN